MFAKVKAWLELVTVIIAAMRALEAAIPESGMGTAKLTALRAALEAGWDAVREVLGPLEAVWPKIQDIAARLVAAFNATGLFSQKAKE